MLGFLRARGVRDADDLANEVLVRVFRRIGRFDGNVAQFRAWVFRIARNLIIDDQRRAGRRRHGELTRSGELPDEPQLVEVDVDHGDRIRQMLAALSAEQREVLLLRVVVGLSVDETAEVVGKRAGAVRALQHRALAALRREISRKA